MKKFYSTLISLQVGDRVVLPKSGLDLVQHHAIFLGLSNGHYWFIENKDGIGVQVVDSETFFLGSEKITRIERFQPRAGYSRPDLVEYALSLRGKGYELLKYNCEHFCNDVQHRTVSSNQANIGVGIGIAAGLALLIGIAASGD